MRKVRRGNLVAVWISSETRWDFEGDSVFERLAVEFGGFDREGEDGEGLLEGVAEGEQSGFGKGGADEGEGNGEFRVAGESCRHDQVGPAGRVGEVDGRAERVGGRTRGVFIAFD